MGLFDKVRSLKNAITGGGAKVSIDATACRIGEPFDVRVSVEVADDDLKINGAHLAVEGKEVVEIMRSDLRFSSSGTASDDEPEPEDELVTAEHTTLSLNVDVAGEQTLTANQTYEWTVSVEIPGEAQPRYKGKFCEHSFIARASLDCFGNDPDSGWVELEVASQTS